MLDEDLFFAYVIPMAILIIIFILIIERKPNEEKDKYIEYLYNKTSLALKNSFILGLFLMFVIGMLKEALTIIFNIDNDNFILSIFIFLLGCSVYVLGVSTNIISIIYSFKMIFFNSKYDIGIERLLFHIIICGANLFIPITALIAMARM